jgi:hypothetical protein
MVAFDPHHHTMHSIREEAEAHADTVMPGFTHLQAAQPVTFGHHLMAWQEMLTRDAERLADCRKRVNRLPLGAAALAGTSYPIDREFVAAQLGFDGVCENSLDAVSDRDFAIEFLAAGALIMTHLSRMSEELVIWMTPRFGFIDLPDRFCTGSSIMPQKKNPDVPELMRGKTGRMNGHLIALLTLMKGQPLAYNKDNQEDKEPLFDAVDTLADSLAIFAEMVPGIVVRAERMRQAAVEGFATATDLADYLVERGVPFREAHGMFFGQPRLTDALLHLGDVVFHAARLPGMGFGVENGVRGARVAVARLADRTGVQDRPSVQLERFSHARRFQADAVALFIQQEHALDVRVSHETPVGIEIIEVQARREGVDDVLPHRVARAAVRHGHLAAHFGILRQRAQEIGVAGRQHALLPDQRAARVAVERFERHLADGGHVVVA